MWMCGWDLANEIVLDEEQVGMHMLSFVTFKILSDKKFSKTGWWPQSANVLRKVEVTDKNLHLLSSGSQKNAM